MIGGWPDPRDPRLKESVALDLEAALGPAPPLHPLERLAEVAACMGHAAFILARWTSLEAALRVLERLGADDGPSPLPPLAARDRETFGPDLMNTASKGLPSGGPAIRVVAWILLLAAAGRARLEHGPSGVRIAATEAKAELLRRIPNPSVGEAA